MTQWQAQLDSFRKNPRVPLVIAIMIGLLVLWHLINFIGTLRLHHQSVQQTTATIQPVRLDLANLHLFGVYASSLADLPTTSLQLTLEGTIVVVGDPNQSRAVISSLNAPAKVYTSGETLPGNATLTRIAKHYVVIDNNGSLEKLALPIPTLTKGS